MRFTNIKRRQPPPVIIIALIDVMMVMLIFLMVSTTFRNQPALKLALPESKQPREGASKNALVVTIAKEPPHYYLDQRSVTFDHLKAEMAAAVLQNPDVTVKVRSDKGAAMELFIHVITVAKEAGIKSSIGIQTKNPGTAE